MAFAIIVLLLLFLVLKNADSFCDSGTRKTSVLWPKHSKEARGIAGEKIFYQKLIYKYNIPADQVFRNVYVPDKNGKTAEIDIVVVTNKGLFVLECKNYAGNIYGDAKRNKWIQFIGNKKSYFYSPILQNKKHCKVLSDYLVEFGTIPTVSMIATTDRGNWKLNNLGPTDCILGYNCSFADVYNCLPEDTETMAAKEKIKDILYILSRPNQEVKTKHVDNILENYH